MSRFLTCFIVTHAGIITSISSTIPLSTASTYYGTLPYRLETRYSKPDTRFQDYSYRLMTPLSIRPTSL